jgi:phosphatidylglycerol:prolipoprotein diacylglycerol transferase
MEQLFTFPFSFQLFGHKVLLHGLFEFLGIFIGFRYYLYLKRKQGDTIESDNRIYILIAATIGAVLGARILGSLENLPEWMGTENKWGYFNGNKTLVGGLLGALFVVELVKMLIKEKKPSGDLFTFPLILAMIIGRVGCFSAGVYEETYGFPTSLPLGMDLGDGLARHPVTLYEIAYLTLIRILLVRVNKTYEMQPGALYKIFMICYLTFRFLLDFIKPHWNAAGPLGSIQLACLGGFLYYGRYIIRPSLLTISKPVYAR